MLLEKIKKFTAAARKCNKSDVFFVFIFFMMLLIPMSNIYQEKKSKEERRPLAKYPYLIKKSKINFDFGRQFDDWFNDRFYGRYLAIEIYKDILFHIDKYYFFKTAGIYKNEWMFTNGQMTSKLTKNRMKEINEGISNYVNFCKENNLKCYMEIVPRKLEFAKSEQFRIIPKTEKDRAEMIAEYISESLNFNITNPLNEMHKASSQDLLYFKTDHHWTDWGAFIGYQSLMSDIKKDFQDLKILTEDEYDIFYFNKVKAEDEYFSQGSTCREVYLDDDCPLYTDYKYYRYKKENEINATYIVGTDDADFYTPHAPNKQKVMIIGNSFVENIAKFIAPSFTYVMKRRSNNGKYSNFKFSRWKEEIIAKKPDILIILVNTESSNDLIELKD